MAGKQKKSKKPYPDFPLCSHPSGQWVKRIRNKLYYFGVLGKPDDALAKYLRERDDLQAGRTPRAEVSDDAVAVDDVVNLFLTDKKHLVGTGELSQRTLYTYLATGIRIGRLLGAKTPVSALRADDFSSLRAVLAKTRGPLALGNEIQRIRSFFKYAHEAGLLDKPVVFGPLFKKPSRKAVRQARHAAGERMYEAAEIRALLEAAHQPLKAMILLGVNCGFGQSDIANLPISAFDFTAGWVSFPRPKTAVPRRCPLWPETIAAVQEAIAGRPEPRTADLSELAFITKFGLQWVRMRGNVPDDAVCKEMGKLLKSVGVNRRGTNFYALRHTFETIAGESIDQVAVNAIMGHVDSSMAAVYRERISDARLLAVSDFVRAWLFPPEV